MTDEEKALLVRLIWGEKGPPEETEYDRISAESEADLVALRKRDEQSLKEPVRS